MKHLVRSMVSTSISYGIFHEEDRELYEYSFRIMLEQVSVGISILIISLFYGVFFETVLYMVLFIPLRIYAGGYHAQTFKKCFFISVGAYFAYAGLVCFVVIPMSVIIILSIASSLIILALSPMANLNKPMDSFETFTFKKRVRQMLIIEESIFVLSIWINRGKTVLFIGFVFLHLSILLLAGWLKTKTNR